MPPPWKEVHVYLKETISLYPLPMPPPTSPCPRILHEGTCTVKNCTHIHDIHSCTECRQVYSSEAEYTEHLDTQEHKHAASPFLASGKCRACGFYIPPHKRDVHLSGSRHRTRAQAHNATMTAQKEQNHSESSLANLRPYFVHCRACGFGMHNKKWGKHVESSEHTRKVQFAMFQSAIADSERDKHGLSVSPAAIDLGLLHIDSANVLSGHCSKSLKVTAAAGVRDTSLVDVRLSTSREHGASSTFSFSVMDSKRLVGLPYAVTSERDITLPITFISPPEIGQYRDRLEFTFSCVLNEEREWFVITRSLCAAVGVQADYELLKPKAPYVESKRRIYVGEEKVIPGVRPPALAYVDLKSGTLRQWEVPTTLAAVLRTGGKSSTVKVLKDRFLPQALAHDTYERWFRILLHVEEEKSHTDIQIYNQDDAILEPMLPYFRLQVPGLAEKRPSLIIGDRVLVRRKEYQSGPWYEGYVHKVLDKAVQLRFHNSFHGYRGQGYAVRFKVNRGPFRRMHEALAQKFGPERIFFPSLRHIIGRMPPSARALKELVAFNRAVLQNDMQRLAVASIIGQSAGSVPFLIFGPPGTGKTVTIVETIRQLLSQPGTRQILACAPSNSAADIIAERLRPLGATQMFRLVAPSRDPKHHADIPFVLRDAEGNFMLPSLADLLKYRVIVCTCVSSFWLHALGVQRGQFSHIFIDEAGQAYEPETTIPIKLLANNATNIVLSGDPKQLGPIVRSDIAKTLRLHWSYLDRLIALDPYQFPTGRNNEKAKEGATPRINGTGITIVKLDKNFRSHPSIIQFPNEQFYGGSLQACAPKEITHSLLRSHELRSPDFPLVFHSLTGKDQREASSPSFFNIEEISVVKSYIKLLKGDRRLRLTDKDFGVISPYHAQCMKIGYALKNFAPDIKVGSVEEFQGQERRIILISTVRSNLDFIEHDVRHALGFVANARRFNVAVTRAKAMLFIIGDSKVLALDPLWRAFMTYIHVRGGWKGPPIHWDPNEIIQSDAEWEAKLLRERDTMVRRAMEVIHGASEVMADAEETDDANVDRPWREDE